MKAAWLAQELATIEGVLIEPELVETNILRFRFKNDVFKRMKLTDYRGFVGRLKEEDQILANAGFANDYVRFVTHRDVSQAQCETVIKAVKRIVNP